MYNISDWRTCTKDEGSVETVKKTRKRKIESQTSDLGQSRSDSESSSSEEDDIAGPSTEKKIKKNVDRFDNFYASLKKQVTQTMAENNEETPQNPSLESSKLTTKDKLLDQIKLLDVKINSLKRKTLEHYITLGEILLNLK